MNAYYQQMLGHVLGFSTDALVGWWHWVWHGHSANIQDPRGVPRPHYEHILRRTITQGHWLLLITTGCVADVGWNCFRCQIRLWSRIMRRCPCISWWRTLTKRSVLTMRHCMTFVSEHSNWQRPLMAISIISYQWPCQVSPLAYDFPAR